jgi:hypothetical protein
MATTVGKLIELLKDYPLDMDITNELNEDFIHIVNTKDSVILSTKKPIGNCNRTGSYVYPTTTKGYSAYCPELDEDLYKMEFTPLKKKKK